jgi:integrase
VRGVITLNKTKNRERRAVPVAGQARAAMLEWSKVRRIDTDAVFPGPSPDKRLAIDPAWYAALERAGIENFRFHDLRHSAASYLAMSGATAPEIAAVLGHKTLAMVKRYAHLSDPHTATVVNRMVEKFLPG